MVLADSFPGEKIWIGEVVFAGSATMAEIYTGGRSMHSTRFWGLVAISAALLGCSNNVNVRQDWGSAIDNFGLMAIYPMRENFYFGDVLLYVDSPCTGTAISSKPQSVFLGTLPPSAVKQAFADFYATRPQLPVTLTKDAAPAPAKPAIPAKPAAPAPPPSTLSVSMSGNNTITATNGPAAPAAPVAASGATSAVPPQDSPAADALHPIFPTANGFSRLPMAAIPAVSLYSYVGGSAGGLFGGISAAFAGQRSQTVSITANQIEMSELPATAFGKLVRDFFAPGGGWADIESSGTLAERISSTEYELEQVAGCSPKPKEKRSLPRIVVVNSVYYTRNLVFEFGEDTAFAARLAASITGGIPASGKFTPATLPAAPSSANQAQGEAQSLLSSLAAMSGGPGGGASLAVGAGGSLALNQTFARPMAFATQHPAIFSLPQRDMDPTDPRYSQTPPPTNPTIGSLDWVTRFVLDQKIPGQTNSVRPDSESPARPTPAPRGPIGPLAVPPARE